MDIRHGLTIEDAQVLLSLDPEALDQLPVGLIKLDTSGRVVFYNKAESRLARVPVADVLGRDFFAEVAPCADVQQFGGRFREGIEAGHLRTVFPFTFQFESGARDVIITILYGHPDAPNDQTGDGLAWIFVSWKNHPA